MDNLKFEYFVNEEKKTVVCKMTVPEEYVFNEVRNIVEKSKFLIMGEYMECMLLYGFHHQYKGISKCHPDATFDIETGKRIAKLRALRQFNDDKYRVIDYVLDEMFDAVRGVESALEYAGYKEYDQRVELQHLTKPEQNCDDTNIVE